MKSGNSRSGTEPNSVLSLTKFKGLHYEIIGWAHSQPVIFYRESGDYSGLFVLLTRSADYFDFYVDQCSIRVEQDQFLQAFRGRPYSKIPPAKAQTFAAKFTPVRLGVADLRAQLEARHVGAWGAAYDAVLERIDKQQEPSPHQVRGSTLHSAMMAARIDLKMSLDAEEIAKVTDYPVLVKAIDRYGRREFVDAVGYMEVGKSDGDDRMISPNTQTGLLMMDLKDATVDKRYLLFSRPWGCVSVQAAKAESFGLRPVSYAPVIQT